MRENKTNPWHARVLVISVTDEERGRCGPKEPLSLYLHIPLSFLFRTSVPHCWWGYRMASDANLGAEFSQGLHCAVPASHCSDLQRSQFVISL